jgi:hypothetical protein
MKSNLSFNEKVVFEIVFREHDPDIKLLCTFLKEKLIDKKSNIVQEIPDMRFVSKLKSTGLKKISDALIEIANSLRVDINNPPKKYTDKIKACVHGLNFMLNVEIFIIYLLEEGPIVWYAHDSVSCKECKEDGRCTNTLLKILEERNIAVPEDIKNKNNDEKADWIFNYILK